MKPWQIVAVAIGGGSLAGFIFLYSGLSEEKPSSDNDNVVSIYPNVNSQTSDNEPSNSNEVGEFKEIIDGAGNLDIVKAFDERFPNSRVTIEERQSGGLVEGSDTYYAIQYNFSYQTDDPDVRELRSLSLIVDPSYNILRASLSCGQSVRGSAVLEGYPAETIEQIKSSCPLSYERSQS